MFALVAGFALIAAPVDQPKELPEAAQKELKKLQGKWKAVKMITSMGEKEPDTNDAGMILEFKGRRVSAEGKEQAEVAAIDPATDPKCIDLSVLMDEGSLKKGTIFEGIYKIDGDTLILAIHASEGKSRPANFDAPKEERSVVIVLKKVQE